MTTIISVLVLFTVLSRASNEQVSRRIDCDVLILGCGMAGSHTAYRLAEQFQDRLCIFEQNHRVGGRAHDLYHDDDSVSQAFSNRSIVPQGATRFYDGQQVIKELMDELNIENYQYNYQTSLIKARGQLFTSNNEMCSRSYFNLTCSNDENDLDAADRLWSRLIDVYRSNPKKSLEFGDFFAFARYVLGDEGTEFLRDSFRFRSDFQDVSAWNYMDYFLSEWNLTGIVHYPKEGMSQLPKRMMNISVSDNKVRLFLNEKVRRIDETRRDRRGFLFSVETNSYRVRAKQLVAAIDPLGWNSIKGRLANRIKASQYFQVIRPTEVVTIQSRWKNRWWEESSLFGNDIDRAWTRQNCISFIEILSRHPEKRDLNITRTVYDDGNCVQTWINLIKRRSKKDLIEEIVRGLQSIFTDVRIEPPESVVTQIWPQAWHYQKGNSRISNRMVARWAQRPVRKYKKKDLSLIGEAFYLVRSGWSDAAIKSSLVGLTSQFGRTRRCFDKDTASGGKFCSDNLF